MTLKTITPPTVEPVTVAEARLHARIDDTAEDALLALWITAARQQAEQRTQRSIAQATLELTLDAFPAAEIRLPRPPVASIVSVIYADPSGATQTMASSDYLLDASDDHGGEHWLLLPPDAAWPETYAGANAVRVRYVAGYADGAVPDSIRAWIVMAVATWYRQREAVVLGGGVADLPRQFCDGLLDPFVIHRIG